MIFGHIDAGVIELRPMLFEQIDILTKSIHTIKLNFTIDNEVT